MAANAVASTNEILEQILEHLPMKNILCARQVSSHWKELIGTSLPLKQATFREAVPPNVLAIQSLDAITDINQYRLLLTSFYAKRPLDTALSLVRAHSATLATKTTLIINTLLPLKRWSSDGVGPFVHCFNCAQNTPYTDCFMLVFNGLSGLVETNAPQRYAPH